MERISERPLKEFIEEEICKHYGLQHTGVVTDSAIPANLLKAHEIYSENYVVSDLLLTNTKTTDVEHYPEDHSYSLPFSSGNMYSTVEDLQWFMRFMTRRGELPPPYHDATDWTE